MSVTRQEITIRTLDGERKVMAFREGCFAAHQETLAGNLYSLLWTVTHVPSGIGLGPRFETRERALAYMADVGALRDDWPRFNPAAVTLEFRADMRRLSQKHGALPSDDVEGRRHLRDLALAHYSPDLNGYDGPGSPDGATS
jgi:hypothetical protein